MKIDFTQNLISFDDKPMKGPDGKPFSLRDACVIALDNVEGEKVDPKEKYRRGEMARRIWGAKEPISVPVEDLKLLKDLTGRVFNPRVVVEVWDILDPKDSSQKPIISE